MTNLSKADQGFTLIEMLLTTAIITVLGALAFSAFLIYKDNASHSVAMKIMANARTAMEAGKIDSEKFDGILSASQDTAGLMVDGDATQIVPGLVLPDNLDVFVYHNPQCYTGTCIQDFIQSRHCSVEKQVKYWVILVFGEPRTVFVDNAAAADPC